jgi:hypothetical protein
VGAQPAANTIAAHRKTPCISFIIKFAETVLTSFAAEAPAKSLRALNHRPVRDDAVFGNDDDAVADEV